MTTTIDQAKLEAFQGQVVTEAGAALGGLLAYVGDKLGLWKQLADGVPVTSAELADRSGLNERLLREWLNAQAAGGYVTYDATTGRYALPPEHAHVLATDEPGSLPGLFQMMVVTAKVTGKLVEAMRTGKGLTWADQDAELFHMTERFFRPLYEGDLLDTWIPALDGVEKKLRAGATVADVGCGHGRSTIIMAKAFPASRFYGFDFHEPSIEQARKIAAEEGVADRVTFEVASAESIPAYGYDLIAYFDSLHDMGDPVGAARRARETLNPGGSVLLVEPAAGDHVEDNINPVGRLFYAASTFVCTPNSVATGGPGLGAQAGPERLRRVFAEGGLEDFQVAHTTPFNLVVQARP